MNRRQALQSVFAGLSSAGLASLVEACGGSEPPGRDDPLRAGGVRTRRNVRDLSAAERRQYVEAVLALKRAPSPFDARYSYYDQFVAWHIRLYECTPGTHHGHLMGHCGPMFLPWHRLFVLLFENALRAVSGRAIAVPYWDWTDPDSTSVVFAEDFMGGDGNPAQDYAVTDGPFRSSQWPLVVQPVGSQFGASATPYLTRHFGSLALAPTLPTPDQLQAALQAPLYDVPPYDTASDPSRSFRNAIEGWNDFPGPSLMFCGPDGQMSAPPVNGGRLHNTVHGWVGGLLDPSPSGVLRFGTMILSTSPNDPVFFLHHSFIDRVWAQWQEVRGVATYLPVAGYPHNNAGDPLVPLTEAGRVYTPRDVADISTLGYRYRG